MGNQIVFFLLFGLAKAKLYPKSITKFTLKPPTTTGTFKALPRELQSQFSVCNLALTKQDKI